jgi:hypothetical protein
MVVKFTFSGHSQAFLAVSEEKYNQSLSGNVCSRAALTCSTVQILNVIASDIAQERRTFSDIFGRIPRNLTSQFPVNVFDCIRGLSDADIAQERRTLSRGWPRYIYSQPLLIYSSNSAVVSSITTKE